MKLGRFDVDAQEFIDRSAPNKIIAGLHLQIDEVVGVEPKAAKIV